MTVRTCIRCGAAAREGLLCYGCARLATRRRRSWSQIAEDRRRDRLRKQQLREVDRQEHGQLGLDP